MKKDESIQMIHFRGDKCDELLIDYHPYKGIDYSKKGFLFSGQGSIRPGILKEQIGEFPFIQARLKEVDGLCFDSLGFNVSDYIYHSENLSSEKISAAESICLLAVQLGVYDTYRIAKGNPEVLCGHSFGDFTTVVAAGIVSLPDILKFLKIRNSCVKSFGQSGELIAVSSNREQLTSLSGFDQNFWISNYNSQTQQVLAVSEELSKPFKKLLKEKKIPYVKLNLAFPYHSPLLSDACENLKRSWDYNNIRLNSPAVNVILSSDLHINPDMDFSKTENKNIFWNKLINQLVNCVDLTSTLRQAEELRVFHFIEIAPLKILTSEIKDDQTQRKSFFALDQLDELQKINKPADKRTFGTKILTTLNKALGKMTGYQIADIELSNRMREDLGIDSIKKAEIIFEVLDSLNLSKVTANSAVNLSELATVEDVMSYLDSLLKTKELQNIEAHEQTIFLEMQKKWIKSDEIFWSDETTSDSLNYTIFTEQEILNKTDVNKGQLVIKLDTKLQTVDLRNYDLFCIEKLIPIFEFFKKNVHLMSEVFIFSDDSIWNKIIGCLVRNYCLEKEIKFKFIELTGNTKLNLDIELKIINSESYDPFYSHIKYINGIRYIPQITACESVTNKSTPYKTALILGGAGGLGQLTTDRLLKAGCEKILLVGRSKTLPESLIQKWQVELDKNKIQYYSLDLSDSDKLRGFLISKTKEFLNIDLIVNSAGVAVNRNFENVLSDELLSEMASKVIPSLILNEFIQTHNKSDIINFASIAGDFGNPGQGSYSLANYILNEISELNTNVTNISWPAWENIGMASDSLSNKAIKLSGLSALTLNQGTEFIDSLIQKKITGRKMILDPSLLPRYTSIGQTNSAYKKLYGKIPSRENVISLSGVTLQNLPFYRDHLVKGRCVLPGSASFALMFYAFYSDFGIIPQVEDFTAYTVAIVQENYSNFVLTKKYIKGLWIYSIRSNYIHAEAKFRSIEVSTPIIKNKFKFNSIAELDINSLKMDAIYLGAKFIQAHRAWVSEENELLLMVDLKKSPLFSGVPLWDKIHKLVEMAAHTFGETVWCQSQYQVIPKEYKKVNFFTKNLTGNIFYFYASDIKIGTTDTEGNLSIYNSSGDIAVEFQGVKMSIIHDSSNIKKFKKINSDQMNFNELLKII